MINFSAQIISIIFHPAVISVVTPFVLFFLIEHKISYSLFWFFYPLFFIALVILFTLYGMRRKMFSDFDVTNRAERKPLYLFVIILSVIYLILLFLFGGPKSFMALGLGVLIGAVIFEMINRRLKASVHVAAVAAFMCTLALLYGGFYLLLPLLIPLIAWSRIHMKRHTFSEAVTGGTVGIFLTVTIYLVIEYILHTYGGA